MVADTSATESRPQPDLGRGGYVAVDRRGREEALRLGGSHAARGALTVKEDETPNPIGVDLLCADAVVLHASALPDLVQETRLPGVVHVPLPPCISAPFVLAGSREIRWLGLCSAGYRTKTSLCKGTLSTSNLSWAP